MGIMAQLQVNTAQQAAYYRDFIIEQSVHGWEWTHKDYDTNGITGTCDTIFDAIEAVEEWWDEH